MSYPTFEQAVAAYLSEHLEIEVGPLVKRDSVAFNLSDNSGINRWQHQGTYLIEVTFSNKLNASIAFKSVMEAFNGLRYKNWINTVDLVSADATASDTTGAWNYMGLVQIVHRVRDEWDLS